MDRAVKGQVEGRRVPVFGGGAGLEALFNPEGQQRGGLLRLLLHPRWGAGREDGPLLQAFKEGPFNTNPILTGYVAGALVVRLTRAAESDSAAVDRLRTTLAPLLASQGDRLFWGSLRPSLALLGFFSAFLWLGEPGLWYGLGYNAVTFYWRRRAWRVGLDGEEAVHAEVRRRVLEGWSRVLGKVLRPTMGAALGALLAGPVVAGEFRIAAVIAGTLVAGYGLGRSGRVSSLGLAWIGIAGCALLAALDRFLP